MLLCAVALAGLGVPLEVAAAALLLSTGYVELNTGQIVSFALLALVLCGGALARGRDGLAGILAVLTAIEPTVGLPVTVAVLCFVPRARWPAVVTGGALALLAMIVVGPQDLLEYSVRVLPAHAASEIHFPFQYSLTYALARAGVGAAPLEQRARCPTSFCSRSGWGWRRAWRAPSGGANCWFFFPRSCAIAGPFLHQEELCLALPASSRCWRS